jgi:hypothetical protein
MSEEKSPVSELEVLSEPSEPQGFDVTFAEPLDCTEIFPEGGLATGAHVFADGRFSLIGAGMGRVIGQLDGLTAGDGDRIKAAIIGAAK